MRTSEPITIAGALATVLSTGVALLAVFWPDRLDPIAQAAIIAFGNSVIILGAVVWARLRSTSLADPKLPAGAEVKVFDPRTRELTGDTVIVRSTPPGPEGIEGGAASEAGDAP